MSQQHYTSSRPIVEDKEDDEQEQDISKHYDSKGTSDDETPPTPPVLESAYPPSQHRRPSIASAAPASVSELPPIDQGAAAWLFLVCGFVVWSMVWGIAYSYGSFQDYHEHNPKSPFYGSSVTSISAVGTLVIGCSHFVPLLLRGTLATFAHLHAHIGRCQPRFQCALPPDNILLQINCHGQVFQGVFFGIASGVLLTPVVLYLPQWFDKRRGFATSCIFMGSGVGGVVFPLVINALLTSVGFAWIMRVWSLVSLSSRVRRSISSSLASLTHHPANLCHCREKSSCDFAARRSHASAQPSGTDLRRCHYASSLGMVHRVSLHRHVCNRARLQLNSIHRYSFRFQRLCYHRIHGHWSNHRQTLFHPRHGHLFRSLRSHCSVSLWICDLARAGARLCATFRCSRWWVRLLHHADCTRRCGSHQVGQFASVSLLDVHPRYRCRFGSAHRLSALPTFCQDTASSRWRVRHQRVQGSHPFRWHLYVASGFCGGRSVYLQETEVTVRIVSSHCFASWN